MEYIEKLIFVIIIAVLLISAVYFIFFTGEEDTESPEFTFITGNISALAGEISSIYVEFEDNIEVTNASIYYRYEFDKKWTMSSILNGSINISIPSYSDDDLNYYVEINDAADNGPVRSPIQNDSYYVISVTKEDDNGDDDPDDEVSSHVVFVEEGTATWCSNCPEVAEVLHDLFDSDDPDFYYVSLVHDKNSVAANRLDNDFNKLGFPTVYVDGGYDVILGSDNFRSKFQKSLDEANNRDVPNIYLNLTSEWNETRNEIKNTVLIKNNDDENYDGRLKIYITEITSAWRDNNNERYSYTLIDYGYNNVITLDVDENKSISEIWELPDNVDKDNLWIMAVLFNSDSNPSNSDPIDNSNPFNAYYTDAAHGVKVTEEVSQEPPSIIISIPKDFTHYFLGIEIENSLLSKTWVIGKLTIEVDIESKSIIDRVEYIIKGPLREFSQTIDEWPYSYEWDKLSFGKYTISVTLYDENGITAADDIEVFIFSL
ncbi:hypothetical protein ACFL1L_01630 [Thermoplasmatota archaeon]